MTGENLIADGGTMGAAMTGGIDLSGLVPASMQN